MLSLDTRKESGLIEDVTEECISPGINSIQIPPFDNVNNI